MTITGKCSIKKDTIDNQLEVICKRRNSKNSYIKIFDFIREMMIDPRSDTEKPNRLKYFDKEVYSRRVNYKDRLSDSIIDVKDKVYIRDIFNSDS